jgi:GNAT superfamily N-acetyltransferase
VHLRAADPGEHRLLSEIAYQSKAHWGYGSADLDAWHHDLTVTRESMLERATVVAELDGVVAGFYQQHLEASHAVLDHLWVSPAFMGRRVGAALLAHALQHARAGGVREMHIDADPHAEAFYASFGAVRVAQVGAPIEGQPQRVRPQLVLAVL